MVGSSLPFSDLHRPIVVVSAPTHLESGVHYTTLQQPSRNNPLAQVWFPIHIPDVLPHCFPAARPTTSPTTSCRCSKHAVSFQCYPMHPLVLKVVRVLYCIIICAHRNTTYPFLRSFEQSLVASNGLVNLRDMLLRHQNTKLPNKLIPKSMTTHDYYLTLLS